MSLSGIEAAGAESAENLLMESLLGCAAKPPTTNSSTFSSYMVEFSRKRKASDSDNQDIIDIDVDDIFSCNDDEERHLKSKFFREAHSQTEKRRRDKMNTLIEELSTMIPQCSSMSRKLDKLTVLRMAVQYMKSLKGTKRYYVEDSYKPSFLEDDELRQLILRAADGFLFVVGCDRGKILFVSESVSKILNYSQSELMGQSLFDYLHPKDVAKIKEQLSLSDVSPREKLVDAKTGLQVQTDCQAGTSRLHCGARRAFFCRMKYRRVTVKQENEYLSNSKKKDHKRYCTIHCTGYLRSWPPSVVGVDQEREAEKESHNFDCLVAIGRLHPYIAPQNSCEITVKPTEFVTRYTMDGKFVYVDQRATAILGYLPQELLGTSCYEYFHEDNLSHLTEQHKAVLQSKEKILTGNYKFKTKDGSFITLKSQWFSFINPWTKELEYIVSINTLVSGHIVPGDDVSLHGGSQSSEGTSKHSFLNVPGISSGTILGAGSIGTDIANAILDLERLQSPSKNELSPSDLLNKSPTVLSVPKKEMLELYPSEIEEFEISSQGQCSSSFTNHQNLLSDASQLDFEEMCENDETAMAALMNYLEAEGGLGDPVDLSDMQWTF
ncbi:hypothetical protein NDU88_005180 [Pleurodeles waltl]|uniref:Aryl hydrocarbon receptor nuclear translocator-like protein 2 n=1 Tax=Pleurodeles waltl TaxID=8319 RepID=A0AAV7SKZ5_PLEWA|nr:hypothetical protein NDU88_005180 [Pleurodeles waltl]